MKKPFLLACIVYFLSAAVIFPFVRWYADNPDTFQYLAITAKYLSGDWPHAVNGYWSPLISWLLAIPVFLFNDDLLAFKFLQLLIGAFTLFQWCRLINLLPFLKKIQNILFFIIIPFLLDYALLNATPDLLFMGLSMLLINQLLTGRINSDKKSAIKTGITGGLLFLAKSFGFPFFIALTFFAFLVENKLTGREKNISKNILFLYSAFLVVSTLWILPLSLHYNCFTIGEAARFNMSRDVAPLPEKPDELPILGKGLLSPQPYCFSAWETPGEYVSKDIITPFNSPGEYLKIIWRNILSIYYSDFRRQTGILFLMLLFIFIIRKGFKYFANEKWIIILLLFILLLYGGYSLILVHTRYVWINTLLMMLLSVYFIQSVFDTRPMRFALIISMSLLFLVFVKRPFKEIFYTSDKNTPAHWIYNSMKHPFDTLWIFYRPDRNLQHDMAEIRSKNIITGNIASLKQKPGERDPYTNALRIAISSNCYYYGQLDDELIFQQQEVELQKMNIDFLVTWGNTEWGNGAPAYFNMETGLRIYKLK